MAEYVLTCSHDEFDVACEQYAKSESGCPTRVALRLESRKSTVERQKCHYGIYGSRHGRSNDATGCTSHDNETITQRLRHGSHCVRNGRARNTWDVDEQGSSHTSTIIRVVSEPKEKHYDRKRDKARNDDQLG
ncbi:hypothetical protein QTP88_020151 [Uroleucon formosanum]